MTNEEKLVRFQCAALMGYLANHGLSQSGLVQDAVEMGRLMLDAHEKELKEHNPEGKST